MDKYVAGNSRRHQPDSVSGHVCGGLFRLSHVPKAMATIETVERVHIAPLRARVESVLDQVQQMTDTVSHAQQSISDALHHVTGTGSAVADAVKSKAWPLVGIFQGLKSVAAAMIGNGRHEHTDRPHSAYVGFCCTGVRTAREKSAICSRYQRCTVSARPDPIPDSSERSPCAEQPNARRRLGWRLLSPFQR